MPEVSLTAWATSLGLPGEAPVDAIVNVTYWAGLAPARRVAGDKVIFPATIAVQITDGAPSEPLILMPTGGLCCVRWLIDPIGIPNALPLERYTEIPESATAVAFADLIDVDRNSYLPSEEAVAGWTAVRDQVQALAASSGAAAVTAGESAATASAASGAAAAALADAEVAAGNSESSALGAQSSASSSSESATAAAASATAAAGAAAVAETARVGAVDARTGAESAKNEAEAARDTASGAATASAASASTASTAAGTATNKAAAAGIARTGAESAQSGAESAKSTAESARDETVVVVVAQVDWAGAVALAQAATRSKYIKARLTGNAVVTLAAGIPGQAYSCVLELAQDATGGRTLTFPNTRSVYGLAGSLTALANAVDRISLEWNGTVWTAFLGGPQLGIPAGWVV